MSNPWVTAVLVAAGGAVGAPVRYLTDLFVQSRHTSQVPWGTFTVNVIGSLLLGLVAGGVSAGAPGWLLTLLGTGLCGALTTFSTFGYETVRLVEEDAIVQAALYVAASLAVGLAACAAGFALAASL